MFITGRPANDEMIEGFRDGYDLTAPEPSENRSRSYRHGFWNGRADKTNSGPHANLGFHQLAKMADEAMDADSDMRIGF